MKSSYEQLCAGEWTPSAFRGWLLGAKRPPLVGGLQAWDGLPREGWRLWVQHEGGHGDDLMLVRYATTLANLGFIVHWQTTPQLESLIARVRGVHRVYGALDRPIRVTLDAGVHALDLPRLLHARPAAVGGARPPYLRYQRRLPRWWFGGPMYGICWHGGYQLGYGPERDLSAAQAAALVSRIGGRWVSLCPGESLLNAPAAIHQSWDFTRSARVLAGLRAIVTTDTAIAHLAGAMGVRTHLLLQEEPDWRWSGTWYPSVTQHRQPTPGDWAGALDDLVTESIREGRL